MIGCQYIDMHLNRFEPPSACAQNKLILRLASKCDASPSSNKNYNADSACS